MAAAVPVRPDPLADAEDGERAPATLPRPTTKAITAVAAPQAATAAVVF